MNDNDLPDERGLANGYLAAKLARLERMLAEQAARMSVIERQLGIQRAAGATARPFGQGTAPESSAQQTHATDETAERPPRGQQASRTEREAGSRAPNSAPARAIVLARCESA